MIDTAVLRAATAAIRALTGEDEDASSAAVEAARGPLRAAAADPSAANKQSIAALRRALDESPHTPDSDEVVQRPALDLSGDNALPPSPGADVA